MEGIFFFQDSWISWVYFFKIPKIIPYLLFISLTFPQGNEIHLELKNASVLLSDKADRWH